MASRSSQLSISQTRLAALAGSSSRLDSVGVETEAALKDERTRQVGHTLAHTLKMSLNDVSVGLFRVCEHVQKRVPQIVQDKRDIRRLGDRVQLSTANMVDARRTIGALRDSDSIDNVQHWLEQALVHSSNLCEIDSNNG